jgi:hypothetical protein
MQLGSSIDSFPCFTRLNPCVAHCSTDSIVVGIAEAIAHKQRGKTKAQEPKPKHRSKDSQKLFTQQLISQKSIPFTSADPSPFIGRRTDFLHS